MSKSRSKGHHDKSSAIIRIVLADDHDVVRRGLRTLLNRSSDMKVIGEAADGQNLLEVVERTMPSLVILDISMPILSGVEAARILKKRYPELKILMLTVHQDEEYISQMLKAGADGYLLKNADGKEILSAVRAVLRGRRVFSDRVSEVILGEFVKRREPDQAKRTPGPVLTSREQDVLRLIAQGLTSKQIASKLCISLGTVNTHRVNLMKKLDIHNKAGLARYVIEHGLINTTL